MRVFGLFVALVPAIAAADPPDDQPQPVVESEVSPTAPMPPVTSPEPPLSSPSPSPSPSPVPPEVTGRVRHQIDLRAQRAPELGLRFGSYGRLVVGTDLRGGKPESANVVAHGPRIVEPSYLELDLSYGIETPRGYHLRPVITLAFDGTLFHDTGDFDAHPALRNVYLDATLTDELSAWVGSRMYRGDDIYLFDYWPLDDQNTVGGGLAYKTPNLELATHAGANRLNQPFQFQEVEVADPEQGATTVTQLNRQRLVASASAAYFVHDALFGRTAKAKVHFEYHGIGSGTRERTDGTLESLPADNGILVGAQLGVFTPVHDTDAKVRYIPPPARQHANLFVRYATGLAAFDELAPPTSFGTDLKTDRASELSFGAVGGFEHSLANVTVAALSRRFIDADVSTSDRDDGWEYAIAARPLVRTLPDVFVGADLSYQARFPRGLNPNTQRAEDPAVLQIAPMLVYSPMGPGAYDRPQLRLVYRMARLNDAARELFVPDDPRHAQTYTHFLGFQAEWWFNSTRY